MVPVYPGRGRRETLVAVGDDVGASNRGDYAGCEGVAEEGADPIGVGALLRDRHLIELPLEPLAERRALRFRW